MAVETITDESFCRICGFDQEFAKVVVGRGNPSARLMLIGEAPGAKEDEIAEPFVGRSGKLLDQILNEAGINSFEDVYICNAIKCRPPNNRRPSKKELQQSLPWLYQQIKLVDPWLIVLIGATATEALLGFKHGISSFRGVWHSWEGREVMPVFHPSYLLRNPSKKSNSPFSVTIRDFIEVRKRLDEFKNSASVPYILTSRGLEL